MEPVVFLLCLLCFCLLLIICGKKGFRSALSLVLTMAVLIWIVVPLITKGYDPLWVVVAFSLPLLALIVYLTEGFSLLAHIAITAIFLNFICTALLIFVAVSLSHLTGIVSDEASFLGATGINLQQLLIAGIMLGTLGVLTEMVVTQVATVMEFMEAHPTIDKKQLYKQAYAVGASHLGSIINTLFLIYAGVSFPLLIVYAGGRSSLASALNYEPLGSEIIRTLTGTAGLIIAMPTSTALAVWWLKRPQKKSYKA